MICFKLIHRYRLDGHSEYKAIGIYDSEEKAKDVQMGLYKKPGFCKTKQGFKITKVFRLFRPKLLNKTFWSDGFDTYEY
ncbi:MAG: hypothetical protein IKS19_01210 [Clostridia bacterium]|nr:hypothetical protein [Clostridia bacterium]